MQAARWRMLLLVFVCRVTLGFQFQTLGSVADALTAQFGFSQAAIGTLIGLFMLPGLFLALVAGVLGRYAGDRVWGGLGLATLALGGGLAALAQGFGALALGRLIAGAGFVFSTLYMTKMVTDWFAGRELATAMSVLVMSWPLGIAAGQIGHAWMAVHFDWRLAFALASLCCAAGAAAMLLFYRSPARPGAAAAPPRAHLPRQELVLTLVAATAWGVFNAGYVVYLSFAPQVLMAGGRSATEAAGIISLASWVMIFSAVLCGQIADRTGHRAAILVGCIAIGTPAVLLLPHGEWAVALSLVFGLFGGAPAGLVMALAGEAMAPQRRAFGMGVFMSLYFLLMSLAPPVAGWLRDTTGSVVVPLVFGALLYGSTAVVYGVFRVLRRRMAA